MSSHRPVRLRDYDDDNAGADDTQVAASRSHAVAASTSFVAGASAPVNGIVNGADYSGDGDEASRQRTVARTRSCLRVDVRGIALKRDVSSSLASAVLTGAGRGHSWADAVSSASAQEQSMRALLKIFGDQSAVRMTLVRANADSRQRGRNANGEEPGRPVSSSSSLDMSVDPGRYAEVTDKAIRSSLSGVDGVIRRAAAAATGNTRRDATAASGRAREQGRSVPLNAVQLPLSSFPTAAFLPLTPDCVRAQRGVGQDANEDEDEEQTANIRFDIMQPCGYHQASRPDAVGRSKDDWCASDSDGSMLSEPTSSGTLTLSADAIRLMQVRTITITLMSAGLSLCVALCPHERRS